MIALLRSQARSFRAVLRRCACHADYSRDPFVLVRAGPKGSSLEAVLTETALRLDLPAQNTQATVAFPASVLARIEGAGDDVVNLEEILPGQGKATWTEAGSPASQEFAAISSDSHLSLPPVPSRLADPGEYFRLALADAAQTAAKQLAGKNLHRVLLRASKGQIVATDGRQLLVQGGFRFPWKEDLLVPRVDAWASRELPDGAKVAIARNASHVFVCIGPWTFALLADLDARFPPYEGIIPAPKDVTTRLRLSPEGIALLKKELPRMPGARDPTAPVTLDMGKQQVKVRAGESAREAIVLKLASAQIDGPAAVVETDRKPLLRALKLGFNEIEIVQASRPLCCRDGRREYVWMPLTEPAAPAPPTTPEKKETLPVSQSSNAQRQVESRETGPPAMVADPIAEAEAIRELLGEAQSRLGRLLSALKQHRRQSRTLQAAVASLQNLRLDR